MKKCCSSKAFTLIELMVSIFITITVIASFYKLYNASVKTERSSSIRVAVNLMGEQMLDTIAESVRLIGLNSTKTSFIGDSANGSNIILAAEGGKFEFLSPFGSPITKVKEVDEEEGYNFFPHCKFYLFNSAALYNGINKLYFHNQDGVFKTTSMGTPSFSGDDVTVETYFDEESASGTCKEVFPNGSLVTGEDFRYTLQYTASGKINTLTLSYKKEISSGVWECDKENDDECKLIDFSYNPNSNTSINFYSMPKFIMEYLVEDCDVNVNPPDCHTNWMSSVSDAKNIKEIIAVRFGFVLLSRKERVYAGSDIQGDFPKYCIFEDKIQENSNYYCYNPDSSDSLNYTASVFRRVVYLSNYRFFIDQSR